MVCLIETGTCVFQWRKNQSQFLPRLDLTSYVCCLLLNSFLTTKRHPSDVEPSYIPIFRSIQSAVYPVDRSTDQSLFMRIIVYNYKDLGRIFTKFGTFWLPCACAKFQLDRSMHSWVRVLCVCAKKKKKYEEQKLKLWSLVSQKQLARFTSNLECSFLL